MHLSFILETGSNLGVDKIFSDSVCEFWIQFCRVLILKHHLLIYVYWKIMLNSTGHVATNPSPQCVCPVGPSKNLILKMYWFNSLCLIKTGIPPNKKLLKGHRYYCLVYYHFNKALFTQAQISTEKKLLFGPFNEKKVQFLHYKMVQLSAYFNADFCLCETP